MKDRAIEVLKSSTIDPEDDYHHNDGLFARLRKSWQWRKHKRTNSVVYAPHFIDVAVKVRHNDILQLLAIDIDLLYIISNFVAKIPFFDGLKVPIHQPEFAEYLEAQIDLSFEAKALQRFNSMFRNERHLVRFPTPIMDLTSADVLVETWESGLSFVFCMIARNGLFFLDFTFVVTICDGNCD